MKKPKTYYCCHCGTKMKAEKVKSNIEPDMLIPKFDKYTGKPFTYYKYSCPYLNTCEREWTDLNWFEGFCSTLSSCKKDCTRYHSSFLDI